MNSLHLHRLGLAVLALCTLSLLFSTDAAARSLYWKTVDVHLRVEADGKLHIVERQAMVFDGDWNGGERTFQWRRWQTFELLGISEILPDGARVPLTKGDIDRVNRYRFSDRVLRWRSRLPEDPPFEQQLKVYEIEYTISGALMSTAAPTIFQLHHDLVFPDRSGMIGHFEAVIEFAPEWDAPRNLLTPIQREYLAPGESVFVTENLHYVGNGRPAAVAEAPEVPAVDNVPLVRYGSVAIILIFAVLSIINWLRSEREIGRFVTPVPLDRINEDWLTVHVFNLKPEVVGAVWDRATSSAEVAALLARLTQEGKLQIRVTGEGRAATMHMTLLCDRKELDSYERQLIEHLFYNRTNTTDTASIREHYRKKGFDPAGVIAPSLRKQAPTVFGERRSLPLWRKLATLGLLASGIALMIVGWIQSPEFIVPSVFAPIALAVLYVFGLIFSYIYSSNVHLLRNRAIRAFVVPTLIVFGFMGAMLGQQLPLVTLQVIGLPLLVLGVLNSLFNQMHSKEIPKGMQLRRSLESARRYFERELAQEHPRLRDEWFPYLLAFGLGPKVDRWFRSFGGARQRSPSAFATNTTSSTPSSNSVSSTPSWTGGGGTFAGAGASGSWASAAAVVAAGVAAPSSSSSSSSGGGGSSSSSGGGGGGGW